MDTNFADLKNEVREGIQSTDFNVSTLCDKLEANIKKSEDITQKVLETTEVTEGLKTRSAVHGLRLAELEQKIEFLERDKRRNNIIIEGVPESEDNPSPEIVEEFFADLKVSFDTTVCDRIYRKGKAAQGTSDGSNPEAAHRNVGNNKGAARVRPIVVGFRDFGSRFRYSNILRIDTGGWGVIHGYCM